MPSTDTTDTTDSTSAIPATTAGPSPTDRPKPSDPSYRVYGLHDASGYFMASASFESTPTSRRYLYKSVDDKAIVSAGSGLRSGTGSGAAALPWTGDDAEWTVVDNDARTARSEVTAGTAMATATATTAQARGASGVPDRRVEDIFVNLDKTA